MPAAPSWRSWEERPRLDGGVVGDDHELTTADLGDPRDHAGRRGSTPLGVHPVGRVGSQFQEGRFGIDEVSDPLPGSQAALGTLSACSLSASPLPDRGFVRSIRATSASIARWRLRNRGLRRSTALSNTSVESAIVMGPRSGEGPGARLRIVRSVDGRRLLPPAACASNAVFPLRPLRAGSSPSPSRP